MKKSDKKGQPETNKRRAQVRHGQAGPAGQVRALHHVYQARIYPIEGCWTQEGWENNGLAIVVVARRQPDGNVVFGNYMVDYYCLGLKDTYYNADIPVGQFHRDYLPKMFRSAGKPMGISPALAHEIIYGGIEYAARFGFEPHDDYKLSQHVLDPPELHTRAGTVKFGLEGKPFFVAGPYDDVDAILGQLERTAGGGNYHYIFPIAVSGSEGRVDEDFDDMFAGNDGDAEPNDTEPVDNSSDVW